MYTDNVLALEVTRSVSMSIRGKIMNDMTPLQQFSDFDHDDFKSNDNACDKEFELNCTVYKM